MIKWTEKNVKVSELKPFERNPRGISEDACNRLKKRLGSSSVFRDARHDKIPGVRPIVGRLRD